MLVLFIISINVLFPLGNVICHLKNRSFGYIFFKLHYQNILTGIALRCDPENWHCPCNGLLPSGNKPWPELKFTYKIIDILFYPQGNELIQGSLMKPYGDIDLGQLWLRWCLTAWRHQAITWTNVGLSPMWFCGIQQRSTLLTALDINPQNGFQIMFLKLQPHLPGTNELIDTCTMGTWVTPVIPYWIWWISVWKYENMRSEKDIANHLYWNLESIIKTTKFLNWAYLWPALLPLLLTHWDMDNMVAILQTTLLKNLAYEKASILIKNESFTEACSLGPIDNTSTLVQVMARCWTDNKPSPILMLMKFHGCNELNPYHFLQNTPERNIIGLIMLLSLTRVIIEQLRWVWISCFKSLLLHVSF